MQVFVIYLIAAIAFGVVGTAIGEKKQAASAGFLLGFAFGPVGLVLAFLMDNRMQCPECKGRVETGAKICPHCRTQFSHPAR